VPCVFATRCVLARCLGVSLSVVRIMHASVQPFYMHQTGLCMGTSSGLSISLLEFSRSSNLDNSLLGRACCPRAACARTKTPRTSVRLRMQDLPPAQDALIKIQGEDAGEYKSKLEQLIAIANTTSAMGWKHSMEDTVGARDRDGTWVTRNDAQMEKVFDALNSTMPRVSAFAWLLQSPTPLVMTLEDTLGVEMKLIVVPAGQILPPVEHPTGTVVMSKALYGTCDVRQMLGDPRGTKAMREAVRQRISTEGVTLYLGGPCRVYGEATLQNASVILEVALIPSLKITSMKGFVASNDNHEHAALPAYVSLNAQV
jgi:hypothetical protein